MPDLKTNEVHVWHARVSVLSAVTAQLAQSLSESERRRANAFLRVEDRERYIAAHVMLRGILGGYLCRRPDELRFVEEKYGKPSLADPESGANLGFNLTHSGDVVAVAVARDAAVGVDVEAIRSGFDPLELAASQFSKSELEELRALQTGERLEAFFRGWTRKEAFLKARGDGLQFGLEKFSVSLSPGRPPALCRVEGDDGAASRWTVVDLDVGYGYCASAAVDRKPAVVALRAWPPAGF